MSVVTGVQSPLGLWIDSPAHRRRSSEGHVMSSDRVPAVMSCIRAAKAYYEGQGRRTPLRLRVEMLLREKLHREETAAHFHRRNDFAGWGAPLPPTPASG